MDTECIKVTSRTKWCKQIRESFLKYGHPDLVCWGLGFQQLIYLLPWIQSALNNKCIKVTSTTKWCKQVRESFLKYGHADLVCWGLGFQQHIYLFPWIQSALSNKCRKVTSTAKWCKQVRESLMKYGHADLVCWGLSPSNTFIPYRPKTKSCAPHGLEVFVFIVALSANNI